MQHDHATLGDIPRGTGRFEPLTDETRRRAVAVLAAAESSLSVSDLARELARRGGPGAETEGRVRRLCIRLYHCHLPKLDAAGLVEFDHEDRRARLAADVSPADLPGPLLDR